MTTTTMSPIRSKLVAMLADRGDRAPVDAREPLFTTGRLDSLAATEVLMMLETDFGIDLADADFDISRLDTIADLEDLVAVRA